MEQRAPSATASRYPCLIRPSYVLSGAAMKVVFNDADLSTFLSKAVDVSPDHPVVISKFVEGAKEIEVDAVAKDGARRQLRDRRARRERGRPPGDATLLLPAQKLYVETVRRVKRICRAIAKELHISGPFNLQLLRRTTRSRSSRRTCARAAPSPSSRRRSRSTSSSSRRA